MSGPDQEHYPLLWSGIAMPALEHLDIFIRYRSGMFRLAARYGSGACVFNFSIYALYQCFTTP